MKLLYLTTRSEMRGVRVRGGEERRGGTYRYLVLVTLMTFPFLSLNERVRVRVRVRMRARIAARSSESNLSEQRGCVTIFSFFLTPQRWQIPNHPN